MDIDVYVWVKKEEDNDGDMDPNLELVHQSLPEKNSLTPNPLPIENNPYQKGLKTYHTGKSLYSYISLAISLQKLSPESTPNNSTP